MDTPTKPPKRRRYGGRTRRSRRLTNIVILIAGGVILASIILYSLLGGNDPDKLFAAYHKTYKTPTPVERSLLAISPIEAHKKAYKAYQNKRYIEAERLFTQLAQRDTSELAAFFAGLSALERDRPRVAADFFKAIPTTSQVRRDATWYLALAHLEARRIPEARTRLELLADTEGTYKKRAKELLVQLPD